MDGRTCSKLMARTAALPPPDSGFVHWKAVVMDVDGRVVLEVL